MRFLIPLVLSLAACAPPVQPGKTKVILGATLLRPGQPPISPSAVVVSETRVLRAGTQAETPIPAGSEKVAAWGKYLIPEPRQTGPALVEQVERLKKQGQTAAAILAEVCGNTPVSPGDGANLWLLGANPIDQPSTLAAPERILKEGQWK